MDATDRTGPAKLDAVAKDVSTSLKKLGGFSVQLEDLSKILSSTLAHFTRPSSPARSVIARSRCDSLKIPSLASASGPSGGLMPPELAH